MHVAFTGTVLLRAPVERCFIPWTVCDVIMRLRRMIAVSAVATAGVFEWLGGTYMGWVVLDLYIYMDVHGG